jgi:hypothetical protein
MKMLMAELLENNITKKLESKSLISNTSEEFIETLVLLCNVLDVDVPLWTYKEEKKLLKKNEVIVSVNSEKNLTLRIYIK